MLLEIQLRITISLDYAIKKSNLGTSSNDAVIPKSATHRAVLQPVLNTTLFLILFESSGLIATHVSQKAAITTKKSLGFQVISASIFKH